MRTSQDFIVFAEFTKDLLETRSTDECILVLQKLLQILFPEIILVRQGENSEGHSKIKLKIKLNVPYSILIKKGETKKPEEDELFVQAIEMTQKAIAKQIQFDVQLQNAEQELKEKEQQFKNLANSGKTLIWTSGTDKLCTYFNKVWLNFTGRTLEQERGIGWAEGVHPDDFAKCLETYSKSFENQEAFEMEYRLMHHSGEYKWISDIGTPVYDSRGEFAGYVGHCFDISQRKMQEREQRKLMSIVERSPFETYIFDAKTLAFQYINEVALKNLGYKLEELLQLSPIDLKPDYDEPTFRKLLQPLISEEMQSITFETRHLRKNGSTYPVKVQLMLNNDPENYVFFALIADISNHKKAEESIRKTEEEFKAIFENNSAAIAIIEEDTTISMVNDAYCKITGYSKKETIGMSWTNQIPRNELTRMLAYNRMRIQNNPAAPGEYEFSFIRKDGRLRHVLISASIIPSSRKIVASFADITERIEMEKAVTRAENHYRALIENASDGIVLLDREGQFRFVSPSALKMFGYSVNDEFDLSPEKYTHPDDLEKVIAELQKVFLNPQYISNIEYRFQKKDGTYKPIESTIQNHFNNPDIGSVVINFRDITERLQMIETLTQNEARYKSYLNGAPYGVFITNGEGDYIEVNPAAISITGYSEKELLTMNIRDFLPEQYSEKGIIHFDSLKESGVKTIDIPYIHKTGIEKWWSVSAIRISENRYLAYAQDITDRKRNEQEIELNRIRLEGLLRITQYKSESVQDFLDNALSEAILLTQSEIGYIYFYNENQTEFTLNSWSKGVKDSCSIQDQTASYQLEKTGLWGEAVRQRKPIIINDFLAPNPLKKGYPKGHTRLEKYLTIPVIINNKIVAVVAVANKKTDYNESDIRQLQLMMDAVWRVTEQKEAEAMLRESEEKFKKLAEASPFAIGIYQNGRWIYANPMAEIITGYTYPEMVNLNFLKFIHPDDISVLPKQNRLDFKWPETENSYEFRIFSKTAELKWVYLTGANIVFNGRPATLISVADISQRKKAEEALVESQQLFENLAKVSPVGIFRTNVAGDTTYVNPMWSELTGLKRAEATGKSWSKAVHENDRTELLENWEKTVLLQQSSFAEYRFRRPDGSIVWVMGNAVPEIKNDTVIGYIGTITDISERKNAEEVIRNSEKRYRTLFTGMLEGFAVHEIICDKQNNAIDYRFLEINPAFETITGLKSSEVVGKTVKEVMSDIEPEWIEKYGNVALKGESLIFEQHSAPLGRSFRVVAFCPEIGHFATLFEDITERKRLEKYMLDREREEKELVEKELAKTKQALIRSTRLAAVGQVSATIAHDLRNPLGAVRNAAFIIKRKHKNPSETVQKYYEIIDKELENADTIITNLLMLAKIKEPHITLCYLHDIVAEALSDNYNKLSINLQIDTDPDPFEIWGDFALLKQVFRNLLENAAQSADGQRKVLIEAKVFNGNLNIIIADDGPGIPESIRDSIFEPLITSKAKGTGLGLTISKQIIEKHNGSISLCESKHQGAGFNIILPCHSA